MRKYLLVVSMRKYQPEVENERMMRLTLSLAYVG